VHVQFVRADGIPKEIDFSSLYLGGRTLFINVNARRPYSTIIGHEFLHYLRTANPALYTLFKKVAQPLMAAKADAALVRDMKTYLGLGRSQMAAMARGEEEVNANSNGRLFYGHELLDMERTERLSLQWGAALASKQPLPSAHLNDFTVRFLSQSGDVRYSRPPPHPWRRRL